MKKLPNDLLVDTYQMACRLELSLEFVQLLKQEITRRGLDYKIPVIELRKKDKVTIKM
ncbi:sporulation histidine kinase inhibitor Sda [Halobacillus sp. BBL2006]|uniref:sporulation histidine kinase inhibitor Sda n=1 Tax=Halobacillus sp. BBL2006 TaxID=1543706 RepID=UPI0009DFD770|nr:sporulation histidine kinase inhibitor Sda [Halobacillus sp. BBL2006]